MNFYIYKEKEIFVMSSDLNQIGHEYNYDNNYFRMIIVALAKTLNRQLRWVYRFETQKKCVSLPVFTTMTGEERFLLDSFVDDITDRRVELGTDVKPRGIINLENWGPTSDEFANPNIYIPKTVKIDRELKRIVTKVKAIPIQFTFNFEIHLNSENEVYNINVNDKIEKKNNLTYLSWAWAWAEFKKIYPNAQYEIVKNNGIPYFADGSGAMVYTNVTADNLTYEMWLPVMDHRNEALKIGEFTMFDVNKTIMRCLTKNLAMFGLGLYIYAGEDLPESETVDEKETKTPIAKGQPISVASEPMFLEPKSDNTVKSLISIINNKVAKIEIPLDKFNEWLVNKYATSDLFLLDVTKLSQIIKFLEQRETKVK